MQAFDLSADNKLEGSSLIQSGGRSVDDFIKEFQIVWPQNSFPFCLTLRDIILKLLHNFFCTKLEPLPIFTSKRLGLC